ncbi:hypothetical protein DEA98_19325 [Brucella pseudogrignonensis]|nr:hypothetical protein [Brucella pseudogrignonensis]
MKISYINSVCVANDAISNAIVQEIKWVREKASNEVVLLHLPAITPKFHTHWSNLLEKLYSTPIFKAAI